MVPGSRTEGGTSTHLLSARVRKTIQSIKEIVGNHSDVDIYVALKETNMDPNETAQKLLNQGVTEYNSQQLFVLLRTVCCIGKIFLVHDGADTQTRGMRIGKVSSKEEKSKGQNASLGKSKSDKKQSIPWKQNYNYKEQI